MIRRADARDVSAVGRLVGAAYSGYLDRMSVPPAPMLTDYAQVIGEGVADVLSVDDQLIGLVLMIPAPDHLLVENVAVHPGFQGQGWGRRLMAHAEAKARRAGLGELRLYTNEVMTENIDFYRRLGFTEVDRRAEGGYDRVFMHKQLVVVRPALPADYEPLGELLVDAYDSVPGATVDPEYNTELRDVGSRVGVATVLVAVIGGRVVGGITYVDGGPLAELSGPGDVEIRMFAVAPTPAALAWEAPYSAHASRLPLKPSGSASGCPRRRG